MTINCNGFRSQIKQAAFCASIVHHNPDIIFDCESKISPDIATYSIFPVNYSVHREDRNTKGGGRVFIAIIKTLVSASIPDINVNCEVIWAGWQFSD